MSKICGTCGNSLIYYLFGGWAHVNLTSSHTPVPVDEVRIDMQKIDDVLRRANSFFRRRGKRKGRR